MAPVRRVEGADDGALVLVDATSGAGGLPVDVTEADVYYFGAAEVLRRRRWPLAGRLLPRGARPRRRDRGVRPVGARLLQPAHRDLQQPAQPDLQHARRRHPGAAAREQVRWINEQGGLEWAVKRTTDSSSRLYSWAERTAYTTPFVADPAARSLVVGHHRRRRRDRCGGGREDVARQRDRRRGALPQARPQPAARGDVPRGRPRRRVGADVLRGVRRRAAGPDASAADERRDDGERDEQHQRGDGQPLPEPDVHRTASGAGVSTGAVVTVNRGRRWDS